MNSLLSKPLSGSLPWLAAILSGIFISCAFPPLEAGGIIWIALVPLLLTTNTFSCSRPGGIGFVMGLSFFISNLWWIGHVTIIGMLFLCTYLALYFALWFKLHCFWKKLFSDHTQSNPSALSLTFFKIGALSASTWTLLEWIRGWFLSGFGWNGLAISQYQMIPLLQWASIGGPLLISWWIVFVNVVLAHAILRFHNDIRTGRGYRRYLDLYLILVGFMVIHLWGFFQLRSHDSDKIKSLRYLSVQPNIPQSEKYVPMNGTQILLKHLRLTLDAIPLASPDLVLWPETSSGKVYKTDFELRAAVERVQKTGSFDFIFGAIDIEEAKSFNAAFWLPPRDSATSGSIYHKNHLVIFGEYTPFWDTFPYLGKIYPITRGFDWGKELKTFQLVRNPVRVAPIICFEDTLSSLVREVNRQDPEILINLTNDAWFKDSPGAQQHLANAVFRTVEFDLPMIRSTNSGVTCQISQKGIIERILKDEKENKIEIEGVLVSDLKWTPSRVTFYEKFGNWIVLLSTLLISGLLLKNKYIILFSPQSGQSIAKNYK